LNGRAHPENASGGILYLDDCCNIANYAHRAARRGFERKRLIATVDRITASSGADQQ